MASFVVNLANRFTGVLLSIAQVCFIYIYFCIYTFAFTHLKYVLLHQLMVHHSLQCCSSCVFMMFLRFAFRLAAAAATPAMRSHRT